MKIALTYTGWDGKHENYVHWLKGAEDIEIIRISVKEDNAELLDQCDGLVLSGGVDVHPSFYGGEMEYAHSPEDWQKERDLFEQNVLRSALDRGIPVMGVCRGLQLINVAFDGTLLQDLGMEGDSVHEDLEGYDRSHLVTVEGGSLLGQITRMDEGVVNSAHHQAIDRLGEGLRISCRAADGTVEAIEWEDPAEKPFLLAVQWHPERMDGFRDTGLYRTIRDRFVDEVRKGTVIP